MSAVLLPDLSFQIPFIMSQLQSKQLVEDLECVCILGLNDYYGTKLGAMMSMNKYELQPKAGSAASARLSDQLHSP